MEIQFNANGVPPVGGPARAAQRRAASASRDNAVFAGLETLQAALGQIPDARPETVSRAKTLAADSQYPPPVDVDRIARLLATHLPTNAA